MEGKEALTCHLLSVLFFSLLRGAGVLNAIPLPSAGAAIDVMSTDWYY